MPNNVFPYPGNKARHSDWIIQHIPEHTCYVEPFGGAAGVLFNKPKSKVEVYNDLNDDIVHFFRVLREQPEELKEWLSRVPFSRTLHDEWAADFYNGERCDDDIERAGHFFYIRYSQFGGVADHKVGYAGEKTSSRSGQFSRKVDALNEFAERLRGVDVESESWDYIFERYDGPDTVFYLDPPYIGTEGSYQDGAGIDHNKLYRYAANAEGRCLISYDSLPQWYGDGFTVDAKDSEFQMNNGGRGEVKDATEYLIMNFDSDGEPLMSDVGQQGLDAFAD